MSQYEKMQKKVYTRPGMTQEEIEEMQEAFELFDNDGSGKIKVHELRDAIEALGFKQRNRVVCDMLESRSQDHIDFDEFLDLMTIQTNKNCTKQDILNSFRLFDDDDSGSITLHDLQRVAHELGESLTQEELREMIERADLDGDGVVSRDEFINVMTKQL